MEFLKQKLTRKFSSTKQNQVADEKTALAAKALLDEKKLDGGNGQNRGLGEGTFSMTQDNKETAQEQQLLMLGNEQDDYFDKLRNVFPKLISTQKTDIDRMQQVCIAEAKTKPSYDISSDECVENATVFQFLLYKQRMRHMEAMWRKVFVKAKAAGHVVKFVRDIQDKIFLLGISYNIKDTKDRQHIPCLIIPPDCQFSQIWSLVIAVLLIYTATFMPYKTCFVDESTFKDEVIDWTVDILFMIDILINFLQATENSDGTWVVQPKLIANKYLRSWFAFDLVSVIPFQLIEHFFKSDSSGDVSSYNQLIRLARLPRLYRMTKLMRLVKVIKSAKKIKWVQRILKSVKINSAIQRMIQGMITAVLLTHIFACFWFLTAKFSNFSDDTWVARIGIRGSTPIEYYIWSLHWATQTITTVGYGDIPAFTNTEIIFSFVWMLVGVAFYSFIIGNFSSIITGSSQIQKSIQYRVMGLSELARKAQIPFDTSKLIKQYIESNVNTFITQDEDQQLIQTLPPCLRDEILLITYGELIDRIEFLKIVEDHEFMWKLLHSLQDIKFAKGDVLYWRGDEADAMYFIISGKIKLYADGNPFIKYQNGECFGDQDMLLNLPRDSKAVAITHLHLKALSSDDFVKISQQDQQTCLQMIVNARKKRDKHFYLIKKLNERKNRKNVLVQVMQQQPEEKSPAPLVRFRSEPNLLASPGILTSERSKSSPSYSPVPGQSMNSSGNQRKTLPRSSSAVNPSLGQHFQVNLMETIREQDQEPRSGRSRSLSSGQADATSRSRSNNAAVSEFSMATHSNAGSMMRSKSPANGPSGNFLGFQGVSGQGRPAKKGRSLSSQQQKQQDRRRSMLDQRLRQLEFLNNNTKNEVKANENNNNMQKFWAANAVPILNAQGSSRTLNGQNSKRMNPSGVTDAIQEQHEESRTDSSEDGHSMNKPKMSTGDLEQEKDGGAEFTEQNEFGAEHEISDSESAIKRSKTHGAVLRVENKARTRKPQQLQVVTKHSSSTSLNKDSLKTPTASSNADKSPGLLSRISNKARRLQTQGPGTNKRRQSFVNTVTTRVSMSNQQLNQALKISSRVKHVKQHRQLSLLSQRIFKQSQDQLGNVKSLIEGDPSKPSSDMTGAAFGTSAQEAEKMEALKKLELEEIGEEEEVDSDEQEESRVNKRRTLLDKVVGDVFGKDKQRLYEMFPSIAVITVPKMPIITPKGDEIILRKKYNTNMSLLNEAFEQKLQLFDQDGGGTAPQQAYGSQEDITPTHDGDSTPMTKVSINGPPQMMRNAPASGDGITFTSSFNAAKERPTKPSFHRLGSASKQRPSSSVSRRSNKPKINVNLLEPSPDKKEQQQQLFNTISSTNKLASSEINYLGDDLNELRSSRTSDRALDDSVLLSPSMRKIDADFHGANGRPKSSADLRHEFISPQVLGKLRDFSRRIQEKVSGNNSESVDRKNQSHSQNLPPINLKQIHNEKSKDQKLPGLNLNGSQLNEMLSPESQEARLVSQTTLLSSPDRKEDMKRRVEVLELLKDFIGGDEAGHGAQPQSLEVLKLFGKEAMQSARRNSARHSSRIEFIGNESMKGIVKFNLDSYLLGLNTFEAISMFDHVHESVNGIKKKLNQVSLHIDSIERRQSRLDGNADKMIQQMQAYRDLKKEVSNLKNKRQESSKESRARKGRKGQLKMQGQQGVNLTTQKSGKNSPIPETLQLSVLENIAETNSLPVQMHAAESLLLHGINTGKTNATFPNGSMADHASRANNHKTTQMRHNLLAEVEGMKADQIARLVSRPTNL